MLTLIKNDLINTKKKYIVAFIVLLSLSVLTPLMLFGIDYNNETSQELSAILTILMSLGTSAFFIIGVFLLSIATKQFNKSMFSSQGYLTFTLPYKTWQVVLSKVITFIIWATSFILIYFICLNIVMLEINGILTIRAGTAFKFSDFYRLLWEFIKGLAIGKYYSFLFGIIDGNIEVNTIAMIFSIIKLVLYIPLYICLILLTSSIFGSSVSKNIKSWVYTLILIAIAYALYFFNNMVTILIARYIDSQTLPYLYDLLSVIAIIVGSFSISINLLENKLEL